MKKKMLPLSAHGFASLGFSHPRRGLNIFLFLKNAQHEIVDLSFLGSLTPLVKVLSAFRIAKGFQKPDCSILGWGYIFTLEGKRKLDF